MFDWFSGSQSSSSYSSPSSSSSWNPFSWGKKNTYSAPTSSYQPTSTPSYQSTSSYQNTPAQQYRQSFGGKTRRRKMRGGFKDSSPVTGLAVHAAPFSGQTAKPNTMVGGRRRKGTRRHRKH